MKSKFSWFGLLLTLLIPRVDAIAAESKCIRVLSSNRFKTVLEFTLPEYSLADAPGLKGYSLLKADGGAALLEEAAPDLVQFSVSLVIPDEGTMRCRVINSESYFLNNVAIAPSKGNLLRSINPTDVPYRFGMQYASNSYYPADQLMLRDPYIFRDLRGQTLLIRPFRYNALTQTLEITTRFVIEVYHDAEAGPGINTLERGQSQLTLSSSFLPLYEKRFANLPWLQYQPTDERSRMLVICPATWIPLMQPFVNWKRQRGMQVELVDVTTAGTTSTGIAQFITSRFQSDSIAFVLLVGDAAFCPTPMPNGDAADPSYGFILGVDAYAEVFVGRFSAESDADVITQVQRSIAYERDASPSDVSLGRGVVIGSDQGPGDDNEMDWEHAVNMRSDLLAFTYTDVAELYDGTHPSTTDAAGDPGSADLFNLFQQGIGVMTYTGHGSSTSCSTTGLSNGDVQNMTNTGSLPFIWSVACVNGDFATPGSTPCFAETFLRAQVNGQPTGAVATLMSSINQSWNPPMDAQDEMVDLLVQSVPAHQKFTFGGISVNGCMHMNDQYGQAGAEMTTTWHCFGDPSLLVRTQAPLPMVVQHPPVLISGADSLLVGCSRSDALISLSQNGNPLGLSIAGNGNTVFAFPPVNAPDTLWVTVTAFNAQTYVGYILVIPAGVPYLSAFADGLIESGSQINGQVDFNESVTQNLVVQNYGSADAVQLNVSVSCADPFITLTSGFPLTIPIITSSDSVLLGQALSYNVADGVPDQHPVIFDLTITDQSGSSWSSQHQVMINAPNPQFGAFNVDDSVGGDNDGLLEPGESAELNIVLHNNGHSVLPAGSASVNSSFLPFSLLCGGSIAHPDILPGQSVVLTCQSTLTGNVAIGTPFSIDVVLSNIGYPQQASYQLSAGEILETYESGDFTSFAWNMAGNQPWVINTLQPYQGVYCAQSGLITDNQSSELNIDVLALADDSISFHFRTSSEQGWDFLRFYIDGVQMGQWSGISPWQYASFPISGGQHQLRFVYTKDDIISAGDDRVWIDNVRLPYGTTLTGIQQSAVLAEQLLVYPNPGVGVFRIKGLDAAAYDWDLFDLTGRCVMSGHMPIFNQSEVQIDCSGVQSGQYLLQVNEGSRMLQTRLSVISQ